MLAGGLCALSKVFIFSLTAALNPTLLTATTAMLLLPNPGRLMLGYLAGALTNGILVGVAVVEWLSGSGVVSETKHTVAPGVRPRPWHACASRRSRSALASPQMEVCAETRMRARAGDDPAMRREPGADQGVPPPGQYRENWTGDVTGVVLLLRGRRGAAALVVCLAVLVVLLVWLFS